MRGPDGLIWGHLHQHREKGIDVRDVETESRWQVDMKREGKRNQRCLQVSQAGFLEGLGGRNAGVPEVIGKC